jgi:hypothetical protein
MSAGARSEPTLFDPGPPPLLLVHREAVASIHAAEYDVIESGIARSCRELGGPHPYLGLQAISGEPDVWFLNGFASVADQEEVGRRYRANGPLMAALAEGSRRKSALLRALGQHLAGYRPEQSAGGAWTLGRDPYLVVSMCDQPGPSGAAFEAPDGTWFTLEGVPDAETALARCASGGRMMHALAVKPSWSCPSAEWVRWDPDLWSATG